MTGVDALLERAAAGEPLEPGDRVAIAESRDVLALGMAADVVKRRRHGAGVTFVRVATIALADAAHAEWPAAAGEVRIEDALVDVDAAVSAVESVAARAAGQVPVTGFSLADVERVTGRRRRARGAGVGALRQGRADGDCRRAARRAAGASRDARGCGGGWIARAAADRRAVAGRRAVRAARARLDAVPAPAGSRRSPRCRAAWRPRRRRPATTTCGRWRSRVCWWTSPASRSTGRSTARSSRRSALTFGADDVDGVSPLEETGEGRRRAPLEEIRRNIAAAGGEPIERDGLFGPRR